MHPRASSLRWWQSGRLNDGREGRTASRSMMSGLQGTLQGTQGTPQGSLQGTQGTPYGSLHGLQGTPHGLHVPQGTHGPQGAHGTPH